MTTNDPSSSTPADSQYPPPPPWAAEAPGQAAGAWGTTALATPPPPASVARPGMAVAALVLGIVGTLFGVIPLTFWIAGVLGVIGLILGLVSLGAARRARVSKKMSIAGSALSAVALVLSVVGAVILVTAVSDLADNLDGIDVATTQDTTKGTALDPSYTPPSSAPAAPEVTDEPADDTGDSTDAPIAIGTGASWEDGVTAVVRSVAPATFGQYSTADGPGVKVTITVKNGSDKAIDLLPTVDVRLGADGKNSEQVYADGCDGLGDLGRLAPGRSVTGTMCFAGRAPIVDVSFAPGYDYNAITWTGKVS